MNKRDAVKAAIGHDGCGCIPFNIQVGSAFEKACFSRGIENIPALVDTIQSFAKR